MMVLASSPGAICALAIIAMGASPATSAKLSPHPQPHHVACSPVNGHHGQPGCWEIDSIPISAKVGTPLFWHVYEFSTVEKAKQAGDGRSRVVSAYGRVWLEAVADKQWKARGGRHVASVGPMHTISSLPQTASFMEATFTPGMRSRVHTHPGPEAWVVLEGEQCLETTEGKIRVVAGESMMVRGGLPMALYGTGRGIRRALVLIIHPTGQSLGTTYDGWQPTESCLRSVDKAP
jgi:quercetin dioxygenase-like cupin family protein